MLARSSIPTATSMIKRILLALDPDAETPVCTRYAVEIARRHGAEITGLALVDTEHIGEETRGGGIGSMYYAEKLKTQLTEDTRTRAKELLVTFHEQMEGEGIRYAEHVQEGVPIEAIMDEMRYHDLLIVGRESHFFYARPEQDTKELARVVQQGPASTLVVSETYCPVRRAVLAYDGSIAAARVMQEFACLIPFGEEVEIEIIQVCRDAQDEHASRRLTLAQSYLQAHGFRATTALVSGDADRQIIAHAEALDADLIIAGAYSAKGLKKLMFGSTTSALVQNTDLPLFLYH